MKKNLKKRLAMVLAAAMVFSTPVAVNNTIIKAAGTVVTKSENEPKTVDCSKGYWTEWSDYYKVEGDFEVTYNLTMKSTPDANYKTPSIVITSDAERATEGYSEYAFLRTDNWAQSVTGNDADNNKTASGNEITKESQFNWDTFCADMDGAKFKVNVKRVENDFTLEYAITTKAGNVLPLKYTFTEPANKTIRMFWTSDSAVFDIDSYKIIKNNGLMVQSVVVTGPAIKADAGDTAIAYGFDTDGAPAGTGFEISVSNGTETVTGSAVAAEGGHVTYNYPEKGSLVSGTYTFKVTDVKAAENDQALYVLDGDAAKSVTVVVKDGVITGSEETETVTVKLTDAKATLTDDKKSIDYTFKAENAPAKGTFEYAVSKGDAVVATGSAAAAAEMSVNYAPTESGKYSFKVTGVTGDENDKAVYVLDGEAAAELDFTVPSDDNKPNPPTSNPPTSNPPTSNPPTSNPPVTNPPVAGTVKKVTVKAANQKAGTKTVYLKKGGKVTLTATVTGTGKFSKAVTWTSSKKAVATVSSKGVVKAKKAGTAKITVASKTNKAKKATITIKVAKKAKKNKKLTLKTKKKNLKKGKTYTVAIKSMTKGTTDAVTYKTSKKSVATVDKFGVVKAKKKGNATITVKCGSKKAKLTIKVK